MGVTPPTKEQRDKNLDLLKQAVNEWADKEKARLENETKFLRSVLDGRGASKAGTENLAKASALVVNEVNDFLTSAG